MRSPAPPSVPLLERREAQLEWDRIILGLKKTTKGFIENVLENIIESIVVTTLDGRLIFFNTFSEEMFGYRAGEVLGRHIRILGVRNPDVLGRIRQNLPFSGEVLFRRKDGRELPAHVRCVPLRDESDAPIAMVGVASDLTAEKAKARVDREFQALKEQLFQSEKMALLGTLASEVAHEINNPLGGLIMAVQMLIEDFRSAPSVVDTGAVLAELQEIERDARRCKRITQNLLDFSRAIPEERVLLELNRIAEDSLLLVQRQAELDNIAFFKDYGESLPPVRGNANSLQQVVINLIRNARDAMPQGGTIRIATAIVQDDPSWVLLSVADSGPGVPPEIGERIFDSFFTTKQRGQGTGLGLAVSKRIVEEHGGRIWAGNLPEGGALFRILLPSAEAEERP